MVCQVWSKDPSLNPRKLLVLIPFHIFCVFGLFPFILSQKSISKHLAKDDIFTRLRMSNSLTSTYTNGSKYTSAIQYDSY